LRTLLERHPDLADEAEEVATESVADVDREAIAEEVADHAAKLDLEDLNARARRHWKGGYTPPVRAADELLMEPLEAYLDEIDRLELDDGGARIAPERFTEPIEEAVPCGSGWLFRVGRALARAPTFLGHADITQLPDAQAPVGLVSDGASGVAFSAGFGPWSTTCESGWTAVEPIPGEPVLRVAVHEGAWFAQVGVGAILAAPSPSGPWTTRDRWPNARVSAYPRVEGSRRDAIVEALRQADSSLPSPPPAPAPYPLRREPCPDGRGPWCFDGRPIPEPPGGLVAAVSTGFQIRRVDGWYSGYDLRTGTLVKLQAPRFSSYRERMRLEDDGTIWGPLEDTNDQYPTSKGYFVARIGRPALPVARRGGRHAVHRAARRPRPAVHPRGGARYGADPRALCDEGDELRQ